MSLTMSIPTIPILLGRKLVAGTVAPKKAAIIRVVAALDPFFIPILWHMPEAMVMKIITTVITSGIITPSM